MLASELDCKRLGVKRAIAKRALERHVLARHEEGMPAADMAREAGVERRVVNAIVPEWWSAD